MMGSNHIFNGVTPYFNIPCFQDSIIPEHCRDERRFRPNEILEKIQKYKSAILELAPTVYQFILQGCDLNQYDLSLYQFPNHKRKSLGHWTLEVGACLEFGFWDLEFEISGGLHG